MKRSFPIIVSAISIFCFFPYFNYAEGTRELAPNGVISIDGNITNDIAALHINHPEYDFFAAWNGTDQNSRMYINIQDPTSECIYLGFSYGHLNSNVPNPPSLNFRYRILDPAGNVVYGPITVTEADANILNWSEGFNGPDVFAGPGGYSPMTVTASDLTSSGWTGEGDFYIEFENLDNTAPFLIDYWDITVADCSGTFPEEKKGRVWSYNWAFFAINDYGFPNRPFNGAFYVCAPDLINPDASFITRIDFDQAGFRPAAFNVVFNSFGTGNTGNIQEDRKSVENLNSTVPEYSVYLNDPVDICETAETGEVSFSSLDRCGPDDYCINVSSTQGGQIDILLDFDGGDGIFTPGSADRVLSINIDTQQVDEPVCIEWDGLNGLGQDIDELGLAEIPLLLSFSQGIYHFPIYDAEILEQGITIEAVRPVGPDPLLFYDDSNISVLSGTSEPQVNLTGCILPCHTWTNYTDPITVGFGNLNTINSWWFSQRQIVEIIEPVANYLTCEILGSNEICPGESLTLISNLIISPDPQGSFDSIGYTWEGPGIMGPDDAPNIEINQPGEYTLSLSYMNGPDRVCRSSCSIMIAESDDCCSIAIICPDPFDGGFYECASRIPAPFERIDELIAEGLIVEGDTCFPLLITSQDEGNPDPDCTDTTEWLRVYNVFVDENEDMNPDPSELITSCTQTFLLFDTIGPTLEITGLPDGFENGDTLFVQCTPAGLGELPGFENVEVFVSDGCGENLEAQFYDTLQQEGNCLQDGFLAFFACGWQTEDACGNSASFDFYVILGDTIAPVFTRPLDDITLSCEEQIQDLDTVGLVYEECTCAHLVVEEIVIDQICANSMIERIYTVTDHCGNTRTERQLISVIDSEAPDLMFYDNDLLEFESGDRIEVECEAGFFPEWIRDLDESSVRAFDECAGEIEYTYSFEETNMGSCNEDGFILEYRATWTADDQCGNISTLFLDFVLVDNTPPEILAFPDSDCPDIPDPGDLVVEDNCGVEIINVSVDSSTSVCSEGKTYIFTWQISDICNNTVTVSRTYNAGDITPPSFRIADPDLFDLLNNDTLQISCSDWDESFWMEKLNAGVIAVDECSEDVMIDFIFEEVILNNCLESGYSILQQADWFATDECGNTSSYRAFIGVRDNLPPSWPGFVPELVVNCVDQLASPNVVDDCGGVQIDITDSIVDGSCPVIEVIFRSVEAHDMCGKVSSWNQRIEVISETGPDFSQNDSIICSNVLIEPIVFDPCTNEILPLRIILDEEIEGCGGSVRKVEWVAQGICAEESSFTQYYYDLGNIQSSLSIPKWGNLLVNDGDTIFRNCDDGYLRYDDLELVDTCAFAKEFLVLVYPENTQCDIDQVVQMDRFEVSIQYNCGITDSLEFRVSYVDNKPPFFVSVPADITISCDPDLLPDVAEADDNCTNATVSFTDRTINEDPQVLERVWYAIDFCGNLDSAIQTITVSGELNCSVIIPDQVPCFKDSVWIFSDIIGGQAPFDHRWEVRGGGCSIIYDGGDSILVETGFGGFVIELVVTDQFGCDTRCEGIGECMLKKGQPGGSFPVRPIFDEIGLSPNPTRGILNVQIDRDTYNRLTVLNQLGQKMLEISTNTADFSGQIELDHLPAGIYFLKAEGTEVSATKKFVIAR